MTPLFWQRFLAGEFSLRKSKMLLAELRSGSGDPLAFLEKHRLVTDAERQRLRNIETESLESSLLKGIEILEASGFPERMIEADEWQALFAWGDTECLQGPTIAIVGTRSASAYGKAVAQKFAETFAQAGLTVVSGGALGIDAAAHKGAMSAGGKTVAVLSGGVDKVYPALHAGLFAQIRGNGCLVSQFSLGAAPNPYKFIVRNRLIAGLSDAVVIIEAPHGSGSLATANAAATFGRNVYVVPGNIDNINFAGSHALIRDGATLVDHPHQILEELSIDLPTAQAAQEASEGGSKILDALTTTPISVEKIMEVTGIPVEELLSELTMLEIDGLVTRDGGGFAARL